MFGNRWEQSVFLYSRNGDAKVIIRNVIIGSRKRAELKISISSRRDRNGADLISRTFIMNERKELSFDRTSFFAIL